MYITCRFEPSNIAYTTGYILERSSKNDDGKWLANIKSTNKIYLVAISEVIKEKGHFEERLVVHHIQTLGSPYSCDLMLLSMRQVPHLFFISFVNDTHHLKCWPSLI